MQKTYTAWKIRPYGSKISKNWNHPHRDAVTKYSKIVLRPFFPSIKTGCSDHFLFSGQVKKMSLAKILPIMGQKTQFWLKLAFVLLHQKIKVFFFKKNHFLFLGQVIKMPILAKIGLWPIFGNTAQRHFLTRPENKGIFLAKNHFQFSERPVLIGGKNGCNTIPKLFWNILLLPPYVDDFNSCWF